jgi:hypothetical protein
MRHYYRINITCCSTEDGESSPFDTVVQIQPTLDGVTAWLVDRYPGTRPTAEGMDVDILVYRFENADWSHYPVVHWSQVDYVHVFSVTESDVPIADYCHEVTA